MKVTKVHPILSHFFLLPNTFIYKSIFIKIYMNANIMNSQIFNLNKYDLKGHWRSQKFLQFSVNPTLPNTFICESIMMKIYMNANIMNMQIFYLNKYDLKGHWRSQKFIVWISLFLSQKVPLLLLLMQIYGRFHFQFSKAILAQKYFFLSWIFHFRSYILESNQLINLSVHVHCTM